jgi:hypothetical protein
LPVTSDVEVVTAPASQHANKPEPTNVVADSKTSLDNFFLEEGQVPPLSNRSRKISIAYIFESVHGGQQESRETWKILAK